MEFDSEDRVICTTAQGRRKVFEFERVYDTHTKQERVSIFSITTCDMLTTTAITTMTIIMAATTTSHYLILHTVKLWEKLQ